MFIRIALLFSLTWLMGLTAPLFSVLGNEISGRDLILISGGLFLLWKSTMEIHEKLEGDETISPSHVGASFGAVIVQILLGTVTPIALLGLIQLVKLSEIARKRIYSLAGCLTLIGILAMRWNVVIGGQLFSKSFLGYTTYKMGFVTREGLLPAIGLMVLPFLILWALVKVLPPWPDSVPLPASATAAAHGAK